MRPLKSLLACALFVALLFLFTEKLLDHHAAVHAQQTVSNQRDGQHDFDYAVGTWKIHLKRLKKRLVGSNEWIELDGTVSCRKILDGKAEVEEMNVEAADKSIHIQGLAVRLYNPKSHQWSIYWADAGDGVMEQNPMVGQFSDGHGEFYNQQIFEGRAVYARFTWTGMTTSTPHFEQAFSADGGKTWETNWITDQTKEK
jgi:hypothetical protein